MSIFRISAPLDSSASAEGRAAGTGRAFVRDWAWIGPTVPDGAREANAVSVARQALGADLSRWESEGGATRPSPRVEIATPGGGRSSPAIPPEQVRAQ